MASQVTLSRVWRILKEVDLQAIRREAARQLHVLVVGEDTSDADELAIRLAVGQDDPTRWLTAIDAPLAAGGPPRRERGRPGDGPSDPDVVIAVLRGRSESVEMRAARRLWADRRVSLVTVAVAGGETAGGMKVRTRAARVAIDRLDEEGVRAVLEALVSVVEPERRVALARQVPALRPRVFNALIEETARANAGYAFSTALAEIVPVLGVPLAIGDMVVLSKNQLIMSYRIALAAGKTAQPRELLGEIVGVLGGGLLFRQVARQLVGLVPVIGIVPKVAVAYGGTWAIGKAIALWATDGRILSAAGLRELTREGYARGRDAAQGLRRGIDL